MGKIRLDRALVTRDFLPEASYTPVIGDKVKMSATDEVEAIAGLTDVYVGEVLHTEPLTDSTPLEVTVELRGSKVDVITADGAVTAGDVIKLATATTGSTFVIGTDNETSAFGIALQDAIDTATFDCLVLG